MWSISGGINTGKEKFNIFVMQLWETTCKCKVLMPCSFFHSHRLCRQPVLNLWLSFILRTVNNYSVLRICWNCRPVHGRVRTENS